MPRVYKYRLRVTIPGKEQYETDCRVCAPGIRPGSTVHVAVSPHNRLYRGGAASTRPEVIVNTPQDVVVNTPQDAIVSGPQDVVPAGQEHLSTHERIDELTRLGQLHSQGVLTDAEFAAEKARILGE